MEISDNPSNVLILASGPYEPWTTAGQRKVRELSAHVTAVDRSAEIMLLNKSIQKGNKIPLDRIYQLTTFGDFRVC